MPWIAPAIIGGTTLLSGLLSDDGGQTSGTQTTRAEPAPRTRESQDIWNAFMGELFGTTETGATEAQPGTTGPSGVSGEGGWWVPFQGAAHLENAMAYHGSEKPTGWEGRGAVYAGIPTAPGVRALNDVPPIPGMETTTIMTPQGPVTTTGGMPTGAGTGEPGRPGLLEKLQEQGEWLQPKLEEYKGILGDLMTNKGVGAGLLDPVSFQMGEEGSPISFIPRGNRETIGLLQNLASQRLGTDISYPKHGPDIKYLDYLKPMAMDLEKMRYGIPSSTTTGSLDLPGPGLLSQIAGGMDIGQEIANIVQTARTQPSTASIPAWESWGMAP